MNVARINDDAILPVQAHEGDAGFDLHSIEDLDISPGETRMVGTGLVFEIPFGYGGFILPRSGLAIKKGITIPNAPGLVDSGYRGEIKVGLHNSRENHRYEVKKGDRIAQIVFIQYGAFHFTEKNQEELQSTERNTGGFGSSGY